VRQAASPKTRLHQEFNLRSVVSGRICFDLIVAEDTKNFVTFFCKIWQRFCKEFAKSQNTCLIPRVSQSTGNGDGFCKMTLQLSRSLLEQLCRAAEAALPYECCGLLLGRQVRTPVELPVESPVELPIESPVGPRNPAPAGSMGVIEAIEAIVYELWPANNDWEQLTDEPFRTLDPIPAGETSPERRYAIAPATMLAAMRAGRARNLDIIGVYHSHPQHPAVPSEFDRACAWPDYSYLILSVKGDQTVDWQSWRLNLDRQFQPEPIVLCGS